MASGREDDGGGRRRSAGAADAATDDVARASGGEERSIAEEYSELVGAARGARQAVRAADARGGGDGSDGSGVASAGTGVATATATATTTTAGGASKARRATTTRTTTGDDEGDATADDEKDDDDDDDDDDAAEAVARMLVTPTGSGAKIPSAVFTPGESLPETTPGGTVKPRPPNQSRENRRVRQFRSASEITQEELASCFHLPSEAACRKLGIGLTVLKRQCRKFGIKRWPFRKMKSLDRLITNVQAGISPGDQNKMLVKSVEELEEQKRRMEECQVLDLDDTTKRLQQAYSKANHKARRNRQEATKIRAAASAHAIRKLEERQREKKSSNEDAYGLLSLAGVLSGGGEYGDEEIMDDERGDDGGEAGGSGDDSVNRDEKGSDIKQEIIAKGLPSNNVGGALALAKSPLGNKSKASIADKKARDAGASSVRTPLPQSKTSNTMVNRGSAKAEEYERDVEEKVLTAVKGTWSPARPASRKSDTEDAVEAFLSPVNKRKAPLGRASSKADDDAKRSKTNTGAKRGRKKKNADDDDPLASLAAAALGLKAPSTRPVGRPRKNPFTATKAASASAKDSKESSVKDAAAAAATTSTKDTAATATSAKDDDDTTEDHPAFAVPVVKGARTARTRLNPVDHSYYKRHIEERMAELRDMLVNKKDGDGDVNLDIATETRKLVEELETLNTTKR